MKILELYSGIGGMHLAFKESKIIGEVIASIDINNEANAVYKHNFANTMLLNKNIQGLTSNYINGLGADTILMSPPCQPFTRNGNKLDIADARTYSFQHLLSILPDLNIKYILIENVKGFECSEIRENLINALKKSNFSYQEFILSPVQFGVPNTRHRYYCLAKKHPLKFTFAFSTLLEEIPSPAGNSSKDPLFQILSILQENVNVEDYKLSDSVLAKYAKTLDICYPHSKRSCCFTKAYGRYVQGTGSVFCEKSERDVNIAFNQENTEEQLRLIKALNLRFFTPLEVCRLMSFPQYFCFPSTLSERTKYKLLGNSINVKVVSELIKLLYNYLMFYCLILSCMEKICVCIYL